METKFIRGAYDIRAYKIMKETNLSSISSLFECELTIPNTEYVDRKGTFYEPGKHFSFHNPSFLGFSSIAGPIRSNLECFRENASK